MEASPMMVRTKGKRSHAGLVAAHLEPGWHSAWNVPGLEGVAYRNRNGWHFMVPSINAHGGVGTLAEAVKAITHFNVVTP